MLRKKHLKRMFLIAGILFVYAWMWEMAKVDLSRLWAGLPQILTWLGNSWPPNVAELPIFLVRAFETLSIATLGTTLAAICALPLSFLAARNMNPNRFVYHSVRFVLNILRGTDAFVFALLFVVAVGLGPFAGMLGVFMHTMGSMAKMFAEWIENKDQAALEALEASGVSRIKMIVFAVFPDAVPSFTSFALYFWEFNVRASTVLGIVGAGGIGQELKNSVDLLDFSRLLMILIIIWVMVTLIDRLSTFLQRRLQ